MARFYIDTDDSVNSAFTVTNARLPMNKQGQIMPPSDTRF
ncbi:hypothetical protein Vi05172_g13031 [Venturia inaequalis]|nr:hypothetical protein Vi05172_g13031 [Venturia inaequalis]